ncbi:MAG: peptide ABC transporter substrate-binding protein, partial [Candidatus Kaiserbacteria bacterium]|nr:peptide ABC transporter substrate-binding protein [Candidatus Kaiserbacteria bacterium]
TGGTFREGIVGTTRFVNPVLAVTRADKDLTTLLYDGLMKLGTDGVIVPSIAESVTISDDGLTYNVILKQGITFHDEVPLTARDVAFTFTRIQDPLLNSPLRASFDGVSIEEIGEYELNFILPEAYTPFIENLTFGILPEHIWKDAGTEEFPFSQYNSEPIGSGMYKIEKIARNTSGIPETYVLKANNAYHIVAPKIETIELHFFPTEEKLLEAFKAGIIESVAGINPKRIAELGLDETMYHLERIPLPRTFALFINQNKSPALRDTSARKALSASVNRHELINAILGGYGNPLTSPIPPGFGIVTENESPENIGDVEIARDILRRGGWKVNAETQIWEKTIDGTLTPLQFSITTANSNTFNNTAEFLKNQWGALGTDVTVKQFEQSDLTQAIIRPRDYETLLFGTQLGRSLDFYSFWHSSQRNDPGLNVSLYANITTDSILSEMRRKLEPEERQEVLMKFAEELNKETPAIFLYAPELLYIFPNRIVGATFTGVGEPQERFSNVYDWYIQTESIWPIFKN